MRGRTGGLLLGLLLSASTGAEAASPSLCVPGERALFSCHLHQSGKTVSLCASPKLTPRQGRLHYRFGRAGSIELAFPGKNETPKGAFSLTHTQFLRASAYGISFRNAGFEYALEYLASGPDSKDDVYQLLVAKDGQDPHDVTIFEDYCDAGSIVGRSIFYPLETLSKTLGIPIRDVSHEGD